MRLRVDDPKGLAGQTQVTAPVPAGAFGLDLELPFPVPGLGPGETSATGRRVSVYEVEPDELATGWDTPETTRVREWTDAGRVEAALESHPRLGYRLFADGYGSYTVTPDGSAIRCAPPEREDWRWQRCLIGQILPLVAVLRGLEVIHASAVDVGGRAIGFAGSSETGKSSVAVNLVLRGARLLADDVLALESTDHRLAVQPGPGIVSVRHAEAARLEESGRRALGTVLGDDGEALRIQVPRGSGPLPLAALYFLERGAAELSSFERLWPPDPRLLLGSTFNYLVATPERLTNQLEVCTRLAHTVPLFRVRIGTGTSAAELAELVEAHLPESP